MLVMIMKNIGNEVRKIHMKKNIPAKEVYEGILSRSMYYRFENKGDAISYPLLFQIFQRLNIDYKTIEQLYDEENYHYIIKKIYQIYFEDKNKLDIYADFLRDKYHRSNKIKYLHLSIICNNLYQKYYRNTLNEDEVRIFKSYIFDAETWDEYEIYLIINGLFIFSLEEIDYLYHPVIKKIKELSLSPDLFIILITGIMSICYSQKDYIRFTKYLSYLKHDYPSLNEKLDSMFTRTIIKFYLLIDEYLITQNKQTEEHILQILNFFILIDMPHMFNIHKTLFDFIKFH